MEIQLNLKRKEINPGVINLRQYTSGTDILTFVMDEYVYEQTDLSTLKAYAICDKGGWVDEVKLETVVSEKKLHITWKVTGYTTQNDGWINYFISFKNNSNGNIWNSHKAIIFVNSNINADDYIAANYPTILQQWEQRMDGLDEQVGIDITEVNKALEKTNLNVIQTTKDASDSKNALNSINSVYKNIMELVGYEPVDAIGKEVMQARGEYPLLNDRLNALGEMKDHTHTKSQITDMPTKLSQFTNDSNYQTLNQVKTQISALVGSAPSTLDTLNELANALGNDPNFATTMTNLIGEKAPKNHTHDQYANKTHSHNVFGGANSYYSGSSGMVPTPNAGDQGKFLKGDGTWGYIPDTSVTVDTQLDSYSNNPIANKTVTSALNGKASSSHSHTKYDIGLGNVDNSADSNKNVNSSGFLRDSNNGTHISLSYNENYASSITAVPVFTSANHIGNMTKDSFRTSIGAAATNHSHSGYANSSHTHDDRYYTESEVNNLLTGKANSNHYHYDYASSGHNHNDLYYTQTQISNLLSYKADSNKLGGLSFQALSQSDYDRISYKDQNTIYFIYEG